MIYRTLICKCSECFFALYSLRIDKLLCCTKHFDSFMNTGEKIRILRDMKGYSQDNMADMLGLSRQAYGDIERGKTKISDARLKQIADTLGTTPEAILNNFDEHMGNFFDQCKQANVATVSSSQTNHYGQEELQHQLEIARLETENLRLQLEKAQLEATLWKERYERGVGSQGNSD
jgi:XRE family transcriptional regulator, regulator of sulfur utilization